MSKRTWSQARKDDLAEDLDILLGDFCVLWGFCNRLSGSDLVRDGSTITADDFASAVLIAEGMVPEASDWFRKIRRVFIKRYGRAVSKDDYESRQHPFSPVRGRRWPKAG